MFSEFYVRKIFFQSRIFLFLHKKVKNETKIENIIKAANKTDGQIGFSSHHRNVDLKVSLVGIPQTLDTHSGLGINDQHLLNLTL